MKQIISLRCVNIIKIKTLSFPRRLTAAGTGIVIMHMLKKNKSYIYLITTQRVHEILKVGVLFQQSKNATC